MIAEVIIDSRAKNLNRVFDYKIPKDLEDVIDVGSRVLVPFANFKALEQGYVIKIKQSSKFEVKEIAGLEDNLSKERIELARYMARKYFCNVSECIKLMVTPGTRNKQKKVQDKKINFVYLNLPIEEIDLNKIRGDKQKKLIDFVSKNEGLTIPEIEAIAQISRATVNSLVNKGILKILEEKVQRNPLASKNININKKLKLTEEQKVAFEAVNKAILQSKFEEFLLYGVTGSRKNRSIFTIN